MKKFLIALNIVIWSIVYFKVARAETTDRSITMSKPVKKQLKHHKKFEISTKKSNS